ncbi:hypothetical protein Bpfe_012569 [Biomphalaria pfeifferi]|uniref:Uncharacterized protein n=1 Tax=Biomphalaria pfeifferi TaxID=112525 RepID=A0AAD8BP32_BIOPF|nr:hypothetical protein Bpfe_012569 [Biomphalaria pfeifferi]
MSSHKRYPIITRPTWGASKHPNEVIRAAFAPIPPSALPDPMTIMCSENINFLTGNDIFTLLRQLSRTA